MVGDMRKRKTENAPLSTDSVAAIRALVDAADDERDVAKVLGVSTATLGRALAGFALQPALRFMVEAKLREQAAKVAS